MIQGTCQRVKEGSVIFRFDNWLGQGVLADNVEVVTNSGLLLNDVFLANGWNFHLLVTSLVKTWPGSL